MQHLLPIPAQFGINRSDEVREFNWNIYNDTITVINRLYYNNPAGGFAAKPEPYTKSLTVDDRDFVNPANGAVILEAEYNATKLEDGTNPTYPNVVPQYTYMMNLTIGQLKALGMVIDDNTKISTILLALIDQNVGASALKGKFDS